MTPRTHISASLRQLRRGVNTCAGIVAVTCFLQLIVFCCVHFTDVRFQTLKPEAVDRPVVVNASSGEASAGLRSILTGDEADIEAAAEPMARPADLNRVVSTAGVVLERISQSASVFGVFAAISLAAFTLLGAVVAGGGAVPGVERAVSACTWGLVLGLLVLPWQDIFTSMPFAGVFTSYQTMTGASSGSMPALTLIVVFIGIPMVAMVGALIVSLNFTAGVERGILAANAPDAVDEHMAETVRTMGSTRQLGAVRNDFRKSVGAAKAASAEAPASAGDPAPRAASASAPPKRRRPPLNPSEEDDWKRPI
ncbi:MAG: hypothetical protein AAFR96_00320 [Planctomycetota bacterium]